MDCDEQIPSNMETSNLAKKSKQSLTCKVCGIEDAQVHYGGLCCVSCKMFFRRNAKYDLNSHQCVFNEKCDITVNSRRACRYCRLQKCLSIGMQRELLRASHHRPGKAQEKSASSSNKIASLSLLSNDRSTLTNEQWRHLSNVINIYNTKSPVNQIRHLLCTQSKHPMKIRLKMAKTNIVEIISSMYQGILPFLEVLPEFQAMQVQERCELIERNLTYAGAFNGIIVFRDAEVTLSTAFKNGYPSVYGSKIVDDSVTIAHRTDYDVTLIKLLIPIVLFSTSFNVSIPSHGNGKCRPDMQLALLNTKSLLQVQNIYVEMMFKYMIYRFGYNEASLRFAALVKSYLDQSMCVSRAEEVQIHDRLIQTLVKDTETAWTSRPEPMNYNI